MNERAFTEEMRLVAPLIIDGDDHCVSITFDPDALAWRLTNAEIAVAAEGGKYLLPTSRRGQYHDRGEGNT